MTIIIDDIEYPFDLQVETYNWRTHPKQCPQTTDGNPRSKFVRAIMVHTVHGTAGNTPVHMDIPADDPDPSDEDLKYARYQANTTREVSWHFTVDIDGSIAQSADPARLTCWHGNQTNPFTIGIEMVQKGKALTDVQLKSFVALIDLLTRAPAPNMAIQRQIAYANGQHQRGILSRTLTENGSSASMVGIYGHRNVGYRSKDDGKIKSYRGAGDPGDAPFEALRLAGYEVFDYEAKTDQQAWRERQKQLGLPADGLPGPEVRKAIRAQRNSPAGLWVTRPGD